VKNFRQSAFAPPPRAREVPHRHADGREDPYFWLRDPGYPDVRDAAILDYLRAENAYLETVMASAGDLRPALRAELRAVISEDEAPPPAWLHGRWYGVRDAAGLEYPIWYRMDTPRSQRIDFLDANREAQGHGFYAVRDWAVSADHRWLAILDDTDGSERLRLRIRDLAAGVDVETLAVHCSGGLAWSSDGHVLFYVEQDDKQRPRWVRRHHRGASGTDPLVYEETNPTYFVGIGESSSGRFLEIACHSMTSSEQYLLPLAEPEQPARLLLPRREGHEYSAAHFDERLLIRTNDRHRNFRLVTAPLEDPAEQSWQELVPGRDDVFIASADVARDFWWIVERAQALKQVHVFRGSPGTAATGKTITFPEPAHSVNVIPGHQWDRRGLRLVYDSPARPRTWYDYIAETDELELVQTTPVPGHVPEDYLVERHWAKATDGARIPLSLVRHRSTEGRKALPLLLYGYGAYGASSDAGFSANRIPLLRRDVVWVIAHIRGGQELGRAWYEDGKLLSKRNSFTDFIASAEHLIAEGLTEAGRIAAMGGSAGGMLMGAVANLRPDLFGAIVARVPFVDVLSTMLDASLPLTPPEFVEWGNPQDPAYYDYIRSYSPYDNVAAQAYPPIYVSAGLNDPRVTYWEPAKWVARLRASKTDDNVVLLDTEMEAGHGGASGRYKSLDEIATWYAFVIRALGLPAAPIEGAPGARETIDG